jgi:hypothetical protein
VNSLEKVNKGLRLEQELYYEITEDDVYRDWSSFFFDNLSDLLKRFGLNVKKITSENELAVTAEEIEKMDSNCKEDLLEVVGRLMDSESSELTLFTLNGVPLLELDPLLVENHVWPGMLHAYLSMFESSTKLFIDFIRDSQEKFILTASLEVLSMQERIMSYLFSGDIRKLGKREIYNMGLRDSLLQRNYPCLPDGVYTRPSIHNKLPIVKLDNWAKENGRRIDMIRSMNMF